MLGFQYWVFNIYYKDFTITVEMNLSFVQFSHFKACKKWPVFAHWISEKCLGFLVSKSFLVNYSMSLERHFHEYTMLWC